MEKPKRKKRLEVLEPFEQGDYQKVINRLNLCFKDSSKFTTNVKPSLELKLIYLFSSLCLGRKLNKKYELEVLYGYYDNSPEAEALYKAFRAKSSMLQLKVEVDDFIERFRTDKKMNCTIYTSCYKNWLTYKNIKMLLYDLWFMDHYLYKLLDEDLKKTNKLY